MSLFWELYQSRKISEAQSEASSARRQARDATQQVEELEAAVGKLQLVTQALWELLQERDGIDESVLLDKVNEIDLRDGRLDGRLEKRQPQRCGGCKRTISDRHRKCIYCGTPNDQANVFKG